MDNINMAIYNAVRTPPKEALKPITAGRLRGKTDINPMWRIQALTEQFGPCGFGWKYTILRQWVEDCGGGEKAVFCNIELQYRLQTDGEWSAPVCGTGGSMLVEKEKNGLHVSDECFKMALTDALSVACKALGIAADVYWERGAGKYAAENGGGQPSQMPPQGQAQGRAQGGQQVRRLICADCGRDITDFTHIDGRLYTAAEIHDNTWKRFGAPLCWACAERRKEGQQYA